MRYKRKNPRYADFAFGLQMLRTGLKNKAIAKEGASNALKQAGLIKQGTKYANQSQKAIHSASKLNKLDRKLTQGVLGTDVGQLAKTTGNKIKDRFNNARKGLNKRAGVLGTNVKDARQVLTNRGQSSSISSLQTNQNRALKSSNRLGGLPEGYTPKRKRNLVTNPMFLNQQTA